MRDKGAWYVVAQAALMFAALLAPVLGARAASWPAAAIAVGVVVAAAGVAIAAIASVTLGRSLSPFPKPKAGSQLVEHGVFSVVRHPIYTGLTLFVIGWGLAWSSLAGIGGGVVLLAFFDIKARREERWLDATFAGYSEYKQRVKKLIPLVY